MWITKKLGLDQSKFEISCALTKNAEIRGSNFPKLTVSFTTYVMYRVLIKQEINERIISKTINCFVRNITLRCTMFNAQVDIILRGCVRYIFACFFVILRERALKKQGKMFFISLQ